MRPPKPKHVQRTPTISYGKIIYLKNIYPKQITLKIPQKLPKQPTKEPPQLYEKQSKTSPNIPPESPQAYPKKQPKTNPNPKNLVNSPAL